MGSVKGRPPGPGRPKGSKNKVPYKVKEMILEAFTSVGGVDYLVSKAETEPKAFMMLLAKCVPNEVAVKVEEVAQVKTLFYSSRPEDERPAIEAEHTKEPETCH